MQRKIRLLSSPVIAVSIIVMILFMFGIYTFSLCCKGGQEAFFGDVPLLIIWTLITCGMSILTFLMGARRVFSIITIDETGISRSFLGVFYKLHISWNEMAEVCYKNNVIPWLFFSKTKKLSELTYNKAIGVKDAIQISLVSKKRYQFIKQYLQQSIVGIPRKELERLEEIKVSKNNADE